MPMALLAIHISDGLLTDAVAALGWLLAIAWVLLAALRLSPFQAPKVGVMAGVFFVLAQVHIPLGVASVHLLLNGVVMLVLGRAGVLALAAGLLLQALLLGHGGITTWGVNLLVLALPAALFRGWLPILLRWFPAFLAGAVFGGSVTLCSVILNLALLLYAGTSDFDRVVYLV
ncbi:MAG: energy-coupling factor ABC transporter permease, partial [Gemmataceae bacterium]